MNIIRARALKSATEALCQQLRMNFNPTVSLGLVLAWQCQVVLAKYVVSIEFLGYQNPEHKKANGICCESTQRQSNCINGCDTEFHVCLRAVNNLSCLGGIMSSGNIGSSDDYVFHGPSNIGRLPNPLFYYGAAIPINGLELNIKVVDKDYAVDELIDNIIVDIPNHPINSSTIHAIGTYNRARLILAYRLNCFSTFYGSDCSTQCIPQEGHYTCDESTGKKQCLPGYQNPALNCTERSCESYCNTTGGACVGGTAPVCKCHEGWSGVECSIPICDNDCDKTGGYCSLPGECKCRDSWSGENCNSFLCSPQCSVVGGRCSTPGGCECWPGYTGIHCEIDLEPCSRKQLCYHGGNCTNVGEGNYACSCQTGYTGNQCKDDVNECATYTSPCQVKDNSLCQNYPGGHLIICLPGWTGPNCCVNINDCSPNPCEHAENCTDAVSGYFCSCLVGYEGLNCERLVSHCVPNPCLNNDTCVSRDNGYICCSENYSVDDCQDRGRDSKFVLIGISTALGAAVFIMLIIIVVTCALVFFISKNRPHTKRHRRTHVESIAIHNPLAEEKRKSGSESQTSQKSQLLTVPFDVFMNKVAARIPDKWEKVGTQMGLTPQQIESIDKQYKSNPDDCYRQVFSRWSPYQTRTWSELIAILRTNHVSEMELAQEIEAYMEM